MAVATIYFGAVTLSVVALSITVFVVLSTVLVTVFEPHAAKPSVAAATTAIKIVFIFILLLKINYVK